MHELVKADVHARDVQQAKQSVSLLRLVEHA